MTSISAKKNKHLVVTCTDCGTFKRFLTKPDYQQWQDHPDSIKVADAARSHNDGNRGQGIYPGNRKGVGDPESMNTSVNNQLKQTGSGGSKIKGQPTTSNKKGGNHVNHTGNSDNQAGNQYEATEKATGVCDTDGKLNNREKRARRRRNAKAKKKGQHVASNPNVNQQEIVESAVCYDKSGKQVDNQQENDMKMKEDQSQPRKNNNKSAIKNNPKNMKKSDDHSKHVTHNKSYNENGGSQVMPTNINQHPNTGEFNPSHQYGGHPSHQNQHNSYGSGHPQGPHHNTHPTNQYGGAHYGYTSQYGSQYPRHPANSTQHHTQRHPPPHYPQHDNRHNAPRPYAHQHNSPSGHPNHSYNNQYGAHRYGYNGHNQYGGYYG